MINRRLQSHRLQQQPEKCCFVAEWITLVVEIDRNLKMASEVNWYCSNAYQFLLPLGSHLELADSKFLEVKAYFECSWETDY